MFVLLRVYFIECVFLFPQLSQIVKNRTGKDGIKAVATGNWGCGDTFQGDVQLKLVIQWIAASVANLPALIYYTAGHQKLAKVGVFENFIEKKVLYQILIKF